MADTTQEKYAIGEKTAGWTAKDHGVRQKVVGEIMIMSIEEELRNDSSKSVSGNI